MIDPTSPPTRLPAIPDVPPGEYAEVLQAIKEILEVRVGARGNTFDSAVTFRQLVESGAVNLNTGGSVYVGAQDPAVAGGLLPAVIAPSAGIPGAPTGLAVTAGLTSIFLEWDEPTYQGHAYTEVWRNTVDNLGTAVLIDRAETRVYADPVGVTSALRFYWLRHVNIKDEPGPFNATGGASATTGVVGNSDLGELIVEAQNLADGAVVAGKLGLDAVETANIVAGAVNEAKLAAESVSSAKIAPGAVGSDKIAPLAVLPGNIAANAVIASKIAAGAVNATKIAAGAVTADKIQAGAVQAANIAAGAVTADKIQAGAVQAGKLAANTIVAGDGVIANGAILNALIANAAIDNAKVANISGSKIQVGTLDGDRLKANSITAAIGQIGAAAVDTLQIAGEAVTIPRSAQFSGEMSITVTTNLVSESLNAKGGRVLVGVSCLHRSAGTAPPQDLIFRVVVYLGPTWVASLPEAAGVRMMSGWTRGSVNYYYNFAAVYEYVPPTEEAYTYYFQCFPGTTTGFVHQPIMTLVGAAR